MAKKNPVLLLFVIFFFFSCRVTEKWQTTTFLFFDTVCEIKVFCSSATFEYAKTEVYRIFSEIEKFFSPGVDDLSSPIVFDLFGKALAVYRDSGGSFDISVGPLSRAWGFLSSSYRVPTPQEINSLLNLIGMEKIETKSGKLILLPGMELDWGGIAKGYGIDLASQSLMTKGIPNGFINAGGDLYCWGKNPDNQPWQIGIKHPRQSGFLGVLSISGLGAATAGDYQRYFERNGIRYCHIFDPRTGVPVQDKQSVTVVGPETFLCDALSTSLFVSQEPEKILDKYPEYGAIIVNSGGIVLLLGKSFLFRSL